MTDIPARAPNGRFAAGNPGRPKGARNKAAPPLVRAFTDAYGPRLDDVIAFLEANRSSLAIFIARRRVAAENAAREQGRIVRAMAERAVKYGGAAGR